MTEQDIEVEGTNEQCAKDFTLYTAYLMKHPDNKDVVDFINSLGTVGLSVAQAAGGSDPVPPLSQLNAIGVVLAVAATEVADNMGGGDPRSFMYAAAILQSHLSAMIRERINGIIKEPAPNAPI